MLTSDMYCVYIRKIGTGKAIMVVFLWALWINKYYKVVHYIITSYLVALPITRETNFVDG